MKNFLLALMVVLTTCTLAIAQNQTTVVRDSVGKVKVTVTKDNKAKTNNTAVTVIGVDTADTDSTEVDANSSNISTGHGRPVLHSNRMTTISHSTALVSTEEFS